MSFTVISTFSGCGGSSLGYKLAGGNVRLAVEWDDNAVETYRLNFPDTPIYQGDIAKLTVEECCNLSGLEPGELDILDGSPPCQGFSTAGKRDFSDDRNQLFREFVRLLGGLRPRVFVMENVSGMVKGKMRLVFVECLRALKACGYRVKARVLNAMYFNVPQSRQRLIFLGVRDDLGIEPRHPKGVSPPMSIGDSIENLPNVQDPTIGHVWINESPTGRNTKTWALAHRAKQGQKYAGHHRRQVWSKPAGAVTTGGICGMPPYLRSMDCHPIHTRTYSELEYKRLHSFPDDFNFVGGLTKSVRRIGNSVPPNFMRAIAEHVRDTILTAEVVP